jgi:micrococcal nuclease
MRCREDLAASAVFVAALAFAGLAAEPAPAAPACPDSAASGGNVITGLTDAGTLMTAEGQEIVLAGLAFPEVPDATSELSRDAALATAVARLATAGPVRLTAAGSPDRYGRLRANVYAEDGRWVQGELVAAGLAVVRLDGGETACAQSLLALEAKARWAGAGLWGDARITAKATDEASLFAKIGLYGLVEGRVVSVGYGSRMVFLDFGRHFRTDFTVMVRNALVPRLVEAGITVESLAGRMIRVRGVIEESGGPAIRLADPLALELLDREE